MRAFKFTGHEHRRFAAKVDRSGECWVWTGTLGKDGYGRFWLDGRNVAATHVALVRDGRERPSAAHMACHHCDNPLCVRPSHLFWGTNRENCLDAKVKGRLACGTSNGRYTHPDSGPRGDSHHKAKLSASLVTLIRSRASGRFGEQSEMAREFGVTPQAISQLLRRETWRHV